MPQILSIQPRVDVAPTGDLIRVLHIRFRSDKGAIGSVMVPEADFDPEQVKQLIREKAAQLDSLYEL